MYTATDAPIWTLNIFMDGHGFTSHHCDLHHLFIFTLLPEKRHHHRQQTGLHDLTVVVARRTNCIKILYSIHGSSLARLEHKKRSY